MLGKLIKYDLKATSRYLIPLHIFLIVVALLTRFLAMPSLFTGKHEPDLPSLLVFVLFFIVIVGVSLTTLFMIAGRFYKHLFSDEGYLTLTLPVTPLQHLISKTISGFIWTLTDLFLIYASCAAVILVPQVNEALADQNISLWELTGYVFGMKTGTLITYMLLLSVLGAVASILLIYLCIAIGQLFSSHRVLASVITYFVITTLVQIIMTIAIVFLSVIPHFGETLSAGTAAYTAYMTSTFNVSLVSTLIEGIISFLVTLFIMKKKINLI